MKNYFVHEKALVESENIGENSRIWAFVHILPQAVIGKNANICDFCFIENEVKIGDNVTIKSGVYIWDGITIEDDVHIGANATFTNDIYPRSKNKDWIQDSTLIKKGASIGANATILPKLTVGSYALVGAGAVVTKDVPDYALVYGNPARVNGYICVCGTPLTFENDKARCKCEREFTKHGETVTIVRT